MRIRGLALGMVLAAATAVQAGTQVRLVPQNVSTNLLNPLGHYLPGEVVNINVYLVQTPIGPNHLLRLAKFHFDATSPQLTIGSIAFGAFSATGHYVDSSLSTGPAGIAAAYFFANAANLGPNPTNQLAMLGDGTAALVASFPVTMPAAPGSYTLDLMNAAGANNDVKAAVTYGFGCAPATPCANGLHPDDVFTVTTDRPGAGLTGGTLSLTTNTPTVVPSAVNTPNPPVMTVTHPNDGGNLWRSSQQVIRIAFSANIGVAGALPSCPAIEIRELTAGPLPATGANFAGGILGANLNTGTNFSCAIENDPNQGNAPRILKILDTVASAQLSHRKWYTVQNVGGFAGVNPFRMDYRLMAGDADNNGLVNAVDVGAINANIAPFNANDAKRWDIDGNRIVNAVDVGLANANIPTGAFFAKPAGHP